MNYDLTSRTPGEALWLARQTANQTSRQAARAAGMGKGRYHAAESDRGPIPRGLRGLQAKKVPLPILLALARRRSGLGLAGTALALKTSRVTVHAWEAAGDERLIHFWQKKGFTFGSRTG